MKYTSCWARGIGFIIDVLIVSTSIGLLAYALSQFGIYNNKPQGAPEKEDSQALYSYEERYAGGNLKKREELHVNVFNIHFGKNFPTETSEEFFFFSVFLLYSSLFLKSKFQATPGNRAFSAQVVRLNGEKLSYLQSFCRSALFLILPFGVITIPFSARKQALHDMIAGTVVVRRDAEVGNLLAKLP